MSVDPINGDVVFAFAHIPSNALVPFKFLPDLVKVANGQVSAHF